MPKEQYQHPGSKDLMGLVEKAGQRAGLARGQAFEDFLTVSTCALGTGLMEGEYLATVRKGYDRGTQPNRGIDLFTKAFAELVHAMQDTRERCMDILGDLFVGGISYGENGQFFTPDALTELMCQMTMQTDDQPPRSVFDPACGSGRMLLSASRRGAKELCGQDVDLRCVRMTAINLGLRNLYGTVVWGNTLALEAKRGFRTGLTAQGQVLRPMTNEELSAWQCRLGKEEPLPDPLAGLFGEAPAASAEPPSPGSLF
jgi:hypothetical protein